MGDLLVPHSAVEVTRLLGKLLDIQYDPKASYPYFSATNFVATCIYNLSDKVLKIAYVPILSIFFF